LKNKLMQSERKIDLSNISLRDYAESKGATLEGVSYLGIYASGDSIEQVEKKLKRKVIEEGYEEVVGVTDIPPYEAKNHNSPTTRTVYSARGLAVRLKESK
jgi:hypothetical protein